MSAFRNLQEALRSAPRTWLITGVAGFIGSNLLESLLELNQHVVGLDDLSTGHLRNLNEVERLVKPEQWARFRFIEGDIRDMAVCQRACYGVDYVLHHAALGSVPRSIEEPLLTYEINVRGTLNVLLAARDNGVKRFVFASSSAVYGDQTAASNAEEVVGKPLSPYAASKRENELHAAVFHQCYGLDSVGLRYFNVFGPRQDPAGAYAAVIPKWIAAFLKGESVCINGDGETSRDFCFVENVAQVNLLAATTTNPQAANQIYNVGLNERTTLNELFYLLRDLLGRKFPQIKDCEPVYRDFRPGDIRHSQGDVNWARRLLDYEPTHRLAEGLQSSLYWYVRNSA